MDQDWIEQLSRGIALGGHQASFVAPNDTNGTTGSSPFDVFSPFGSITPPPASRMSAAVSPSLSRGVGVVQPLMFADVTNASNGLLGHKLSRAETTTAASDPAVISAVPASQSASQDGRPPTQPSELLLVRGEVLTAAKLLQVAYQPAERKAAVVPTGNASTSPSRSSTPHSVANAALDDDDDDDDDANGVGYVVRQMANQNKLDQLFSSRSQTPDSASASSPVTQSRQDSWSSVVQLTTNGGGGAALPQRGCPTSHRQPSHGGGGAFSVVSVPMSSNPSALSSSNGGPSARRIVGPLYQDHSAAASSSAPSSAANFPTLSSMRDVTVVLEFKMKRLVRFRCSAEVGAQALQQFCVVQFEPSGVEDTGSCVAIYTWHDRHAIPRSLGLSDSGTVLRLAGEDDCVIINEVLPELEEHALVEANSLIHFLHLPFECVDAEYTFDRKQVKLFYRLAPQSSTSIVPNFSRFQRELSFKLGSVKVILEQVKQSMSKT